MRNFIFDGGVRLSEKDLGIIKANFGRCREQDIEKETVSLRLDCITRFWGHPGEKTICVTQLGGDHEYRYLRLSMNDLNDVEPVDEKLEKAHVW